jgi:hypothetical protein
MLNLPSRPPTAVAAMIKRNTSAEARVVWLVLGAFFALLTGRVLLWEVHGLADLPPNIC